MGSNIKDQADDLEKMLEGDAEEVTTTAAQDKKDEPETEADGTEKDDKKESSSATKKEQHKTGTVLQTETQVEINKQIAQIDVKIEALSGKEVDTAAFYENIDEHLSEEEAALEFSDKPAYMKLVNEKLNTYMKEHSSSSELEKLEAEKADLEQIYLRQEGIIAVSQKYPEYDHEKMVEFFLNDLSKSEQKKITDGVSSYAEVYENTFKVFQERNPSAIASTQAPNIPDVTKARKQPLSPNEADMGMKDGDEELKEALGL